MGGFSAQQIQDLVLVATGTKDGKVKYDQFLARFIHKDQSELENEINMAFKIIAGDNVKISKHHLRDFFYRLVRKQPMKKLMKLWIWQEPMANYQRMSLL